MLLATVRNAPRTAARRTGFTLLEVLVVVAILIILASVASIAVMRNLETARKSQAQLKAKTVANAVQAYVLDPQNVNHSLPDNLGELVNPGYGTSLLPNGQEDLIDPWGQQYQARPMQHTDGSEIYLIYTTAKDGTPISQFGVGQQLSRINQ